MDIARQPGLHKKSNLNIAAAAAAVILLIGLAVYFFPTLTSKSIQRSSLLFAEVQRGSMQVKVYGNGVLVPREVRWVATNVAGRVDRILVKPGSRAEQDQVLLELDNPALVQNAEEVYWEVEAARADLTALEVTLESDILNQRSRIKTVGIDLESAQIKYDAESRLIKSGQSSTSRLEHKNSELLLRKLTNNLQVEKSRLERLIKNRDAQINAKQARLKKMENALKRAQSNVAALQVRAREAGVVQAVSVELGQQLAMGSNLVKIADQSDLIAEIKVAQRMVNEVAIGQRAFIDTRKNEIEGRVTRIDPAVINGSVLVEVAFSRALPNEARPDLRVNGDILIADLADTLYVKRPVVAQSNQRSVIFKLDKAENFANKVTVNFGQGSSDQIQVLDGLSSGDRVILSDHTNWEHLNKIRIN